MSKVRLSADEKKDIFLYGTRIENLFISEFLPDAPGDYVKVYIFGLMYAQFDQKPDSREMAMSLGLSEQDVEEAWIYWESNGLVRIVRSRDENNEEVRHIIFLSQIEALYGKDSDEESVSAPAELPEPASVFAETDDAAAKEESEEEVPLYISIDDMEFDEVFTEKFIDRKLRDIYRKFQAETGRTISRRETTKLEEAVRTYGVETEVMLFAIDYCIEIGKDNVEYICAVAKRWTDEGCRSSDDVKVVLERYSLRNSWYGRVFKALGFNRLPAPADREIMDRWFDVMNCTIGEVLDACNAAAGRRDPNLKYVNKILENRRLEKGGINTRIVKEANASTQAKKKDEESPVSKKVLADYFRHIREEEDAALRERKREVLAKIPDMKSLDEAERRLTASLMRLRPGENGREDRQAMKAERHRIEERRRDLLEYGGFPADYLKRRYRCSICRDSGYTDEGRVCSCCKERAKEAFEWIGEKNKA